MTTTKMSTDEKKAIILDAARFEIGTTVTEVKDRLDGHAGRTALMFTAMCRSGTLMKTESKRDGKVIYKLGTGVPAPAKRKAKGRTTDSSNRNAGVFNKPSAKAAALPATPPRVILPPVPPILPVTETPLLNEAARRAQAREHTSNAAAAAQRGLAVGQHLMDACSEFNAFVDGLRRALNGEK